MLSNLSLFWFHPFEEYSGGFSLINFEIQFSLKYFTFSFRLLGFGFSLWYFQNTNEEYKPLVINKKTYDHIITLTKYGNRIIPDKGNSLIGDYNRIYLYTNNEAFILQPK